MYKSTTKTMIVHGYSCRVLASNETTRAGDFIEWIPGVWTRIEMNSEYDGKKVSYITRDVRVLQPNRKTMIRIARREN